MGDAVVVAKRSRKLAEPIAALQNRKAREIPDCRATDPHPSESRDDKRKQDECGRREVNRDAFLLAAWCASFLAS
jgi:hypothetical protein